MAGRCELPGYADSFRYDPGIGIFDPEKKTQCVILTLSAYFYGGLDSTFGHFRANVKNNSSASGLRLLHSQLALKTLVLKRRPAKV